MSSRIGELRLHLRVPRALEAEVSHLRSAVERTVVVAVIEELERRLHAALGERAVIRVRHLALRWTLDAGALGDAAPSTRLADELARDLLAEIAAQSPEERLRPRSASIVVFASGPHADAARLADLADGIGGEAWFYAGAPEGAATWEAAIAAGSAHVEEVVTWLERMDRVDAALALAPERALAEVAAMAPAHAGAVALARARRAARAEADGGAQAQRGGARAGATEAPVAATAATPRAGAGAPEAGAGAGAGGDQAPRGGPVAAAPVEGAASRELPVEAPAAAGVARAAAGVASDAAGPAPVVTVERSPAGDLVLPAQAPAPRPAEAGERPAAAELGDGVAIATRHAGLFYLVGRVLELDLAEALWAAGVAEGGVLAHVAAAIIDDDGDPAWRWFGGAFDRVPALPVLPAWAIDEVSAAVQHGLGRRLVRFGVARTPDALRAELEALAAGVRRPATDDAATAQVVARAAAALAILVAARLRRPASWPLLREVVGRPGRLVVTPDAVRVIVSAAHVDIDHRRAGLDHDPGHVPWLGRRVVLEFAGGEEL